MIERIQAMRARAAEMRDSTKSWHIHVSTSSNDRRHIIEAGSRFQIAELPRMIESSAG
jgi:hypothetical protein